MQNKRIHFCNKLVKQTYLLSPGMRSPEICHVYQPLQQLVIEKREKISKAGVSAAILPAFRTPTVQAGASCALLNVTTLFQLGFKSFCLREEIVLRESPL